MDSWTISTEISLEADFSEAVTLQDGVLLGGRFQIDRAAGAGGMAVVYKALDTETGSLVALKVLQETFSSEADRFEREAKLLSELAHPAVVKYVGHGRTENGQPFIAMEWLEGEDLSQRIARGALSIAETIDIVRRTAEGLAAAGARGIIHRDVKPANIYLPSEPPGGVRILDFGVARFLTGSVTMTGTGMVVGTPAYMAPEQARGEKTVDARADVFSLGCVFWECLAGAAVFQGEHPVAVMGKILFENARRIRSVRSDVSPAIDDLIARMLAKDPGERPHDAAVVVEALGEIAASGTVELRRVESSSGLSASEQRLLGVVVVGRAGRALFDSDATLATGELDLAEVMKATIAPFDGALERLVDGSWIATLSTRGNAKDRAMQAARCALALRARIRNAPVVLATGRAHVGGRWPVGEVIDRAVSLLVAAGARSAPTDGVLIDEATAGLLDERFSVSSEGGVSELRGEGSGDGRPRALMGKTTPCVGREMEVATLMATFVTAAEEQAARLVLLTGPSGSGKSRLRHELATRLAAQGAEHDLWLGRSDPAGAELRYATLGALVRGVMGISPNDIPFSQREKIETRVARLVPETEVKRVAAFLGELAGVRGSDAGLPALAAARRHPERMAAEIESAWTTWISSESAARPVVLVLEDLQWIDAASAALIDATLAQLRDRPIIVLGLARPEIKERYPQLWSERQPHEIRLGRLSRKAAERLVRNALGTGADSAEVARVVERGGGDPFILEELARAVAQGSAAAIPATVRSAAQARLEGLPAEARHVLRAASVFGPRFSRSGILSVLRGHQRPEQVEFWLHLLTEREVISAGAGDEFAFVTTLVREAAYETLTDEDREAGRKLADEWEEGSAHTVAAAG